VRLTGIKANDVKPIEKFEVSELSDVVVFAGPNGVGKSRLVEQLLQHLQNPRPGNIAVTVEATTPKEKKIWGKDMLDTSKAEDGPLLQRALQQSRLKRKNFQSSILYFESDRSIQQVAPFQFTWDFPDPWEEQLDWNFGWSGLKNRFRDTLHAIFRKIKSLENDIAQKALELKKGGAETMALDFADPLIPFKEAFSQLLAPKVLQDADVKGQRLTYSLDGQTFGIDSLSSGEREVLNITFDFLLRSPSHCIIFFDEPELHLHPELSYRLLNTLRSIGTRNQFVFCTHSPDIISATLEQSVVFIAPKKGNTNQAIAVREDDETNQALRLLGHSIGIVALGKKLVLIEGEKSSLDKQTYGSLLKNRFPGLVLVPVGGKHAVQNFSSAISDVLDKTLWGVEFFMLCDGDTAAFGINEADLTKRSGGRLRVLSRYHLENYFLDEAILVEVFAPMEPEGSWLRDPISIRKTLRELAAPLVSYAIALAVSKRLRVAIGNLDAMPKSCHDCKPEELATLITKAVSGERERFERELDEPALKTMVMKEQESLQKLLDADNDEWKARIPGKVLLAKFAAQAKIDPPRLKNLYLGIAAKSDPNPFQEIVNIFQDFDSLSHTSSELPAAVAAQP
jgi:ABC-type cobalamin/Fe3+-siderophores transport system ATPase subunit